MTIKESVKKLARSGTRPFIAVGLGTLRYLDDLEDQEIFFKLARDYPEVAQSIEKICLYSLENRTPTSHSLYPSWCELVVGYYHDLKDNGY